MSARFENVPVVEVSADNFAELWPFMVRAIKKSSFVALDTVREGAFSKEISSQRFSKRTTLI